MRTEGHGQGAGSEGGGVSQGYESEGDGEGEEEEEGESVLEEIRNEVKKLESLRAELEQRIRQIGPAATPHRNKPGPKPKVRAVPVEPVVEPPPPVPVTPQTIEGRIESALTRESLETPQLAKAIGEPVEKLNDVLRDLRADRKIYNVGLGERPLWTWRIGDQTDTQVLIAMVKRLISERPMSTRDLSNATGARMSRVGGALVAIQRSGAKVVNMGVGHAGRWFLISDYVKDASLPPKRAPRVKKRGE